MTCTLLLSLALLAADAEVPAESAAATAPAVVDVIALDKEADRYFLLGGWKKAIANYEQLVAANPTAGVYWYRLGLSRLRDGLYEPAIPAFIKGHELGAFQWRPLQIVHRGQAAWGAAACYARLGQNDKAIEWTRTSLAAGLRDIHEFQSPHFEELLKDENYRKLVWATDVKGLSREDGLRHDLKFMMHECKRIHYDPFRSTSEAELDSMAASLEADIPNLSDDEVFVRLMAIVRRLGDGHTQIGRAGRPSRMGLKFCRYPEGVYIERALPDHADLIGAKVLRIGDRPIDEVVTLVEDITSRDNEMTVQWFSANLLSSASTLRGLGVLSSDGPVPLEIEDAAGNVRRVELPTSDKIANDKDWVDQVAGVEMPLPLCRTQRAKMYWFEPLPDQKLVYMQMNGVGNDKAEPFDRFCKRLFTELEKPEFDSLVVDLRFNGGGNTFQNVPLLEGIIRCEKLQQPGKLFVIIGRETFSAAQNTTSDLERRTKAILVGEPTGSNPNFIGESIRVTFPYSDMGMSISDLWWQQSMAMDYRVWTHPQLYAPPTAAALRAHRDPAMELILTYRAQTAK